MSRVKRRTHKKRGNKKQTRRQRKLSRKTMFRKHVRGGVKKNINIIHEIQDMNQLRKELTEFEGASIPNNNENNTVFYELRAFEYPRIDLNNPSIPKFKDLYFIASEATSNKATSSKATPNEATLSEATSNKSIPNKSIPSKSIPSKLLSQFRQMYARKATSSKATPNEASPNEASPNEASPNEATLNEATLNEATLSEATLSEATSSKAEEIMSVYHLQGCYIEGDVLHVAQLERIFVDDEEREKILKLYSPEIANALLSNKKYDYVRDIATYTFTKYGTGTVIQTVGDSKILGKLVLGEPKF